ncbi:hypothetical protein [Leucobacter japonicus]|uniref:hypothetical protein n=1 Tax=Leucobacter japonicus TaxID=1461259 RepID=UPI000AD08D5B|nr:hypothetical protein [Leucobacter japonicus]
MAVEVMTGDELRRTPSELRYYVCQQCGKRGTDQSEFAMVTFIGVGFVLCKKHLTWEA